MCGIAGLILADRTTRFNAQGAVTRMAHRGPDGRGHYAADGVHLLHTRLAVIDPQCGAQPMVSADGCVALIANGEIYNEPSVRESLRASGVDFASRSDSEVILHAYRVFGAGFVDRLEGMFAFALYDRRRRRLWLARDRLGIKPLYVCATSVGWAFASEIKVLTALPGVKRELDTEVLGQFFQGVFNRGDGTALHGVRAIAPGHMAYFDTRDSGGRLHTYCYWRPSLWPAHAPQTLSAAKERFEPLITDVMQKHLRSDVPFGLFLSGGVDSALVLALMARQGVAAPRTYSLAFRDAPRGPESRVAPRLAEHFGCRHTEVCISVADLRARMVEMVWAADDLLSDAACMPTLFLAERAAQEVKVVLTGEGGDEVFAGYGRYRRPALQYWLRRRRDPSGGYRHRLLFEPRLADTCFAPPLLTAAKRARGDLITTWREAGPVATRLQRQQWVDLAGELPHGLLPKVDRMLMAYGVEGRVPFVDHRMVEFGLNLPDRLKVRGRQGKYFLKSWGESLVDPAVLWAKKKGLSVGLARLFDAAFLHHLGQCLPRAPGVRDWLLPRGVECLIHRQRTRGDVAVQLWHTLAFALWWRLIADGNGSRPPKGVDPLDVLVY